MKLDLFKEEWSLGIDMKVNHKSPYLNRNYLSSFSQALYRNIEEYNGMADLIRYNEQNVVTHVYSIHEANRILKLSKL
jgi:hypothetical protein